MKNAPWIFPDLPPFLAGLTLEHVSKLQQLIVRHGALIGKAPKLGDAYALTLREPARMTLMLIGPPERSDLMVLDRDDPESKDLEAIQLTGPDLLGRIIWNRHITLEAALSLLETEGVVMTSQLARTGKDGAN